MTTEPTRYHFDYRSPGMYPAENGKYVTYEYAAALAAELEMVRAALDKIRLRGGLVSWLRASPEELARIAHEALTTPGPTP